MNELAIQAQGLIMKYGSVVALNGLSLEVAKGQFFGILGRNGAGKTTLIESLYGARKPGSGSVTLLGQSPTPRDKRLLLRLGIQSQRGAFIYRSTVKEHLHAIGRIYGVSMQRVDEAIEAMGLGHISSSRARMVSGGEQQKIAIAAATLHNPEVLFLDEPTASLDIVARQDLLSLLGELKGRGTTVVYTTHYLEEAHTLCDSVAILDHGQVLAQDSPDALIRRAGGFSSIILPPGDYDVRRIRELPSVRDAIAEGESLRIVTLDEGASFQELASLGISLSGSSTRPADFQDAFLTLTNGSGAQL